MRILLLFCLLSANSLPAQDIRVVQDTTGGVYSYYYQLKNGKKVGMDSVFMIDFQFDCESEGKILFYDRKTDRVGFFDNHGKVAIPANYNFASPFYNGVALAGINGVRTCENCEHRSWKDYERVLINDKNEILVRNWNIEAHNLDWYSMRVNDLSVDTTTWVTVKGEKGNVYSFFNLEKEFMKWIYSDFMQALRSGPVATSKLMFPEITYDASQGDWRHVPRDVFLKKFFTEIRTSIVNVKKEHVAVFYEDLNQYIYEDKKYARFYNACGGFAWRHYPMFNFVINYNNHGNKLHYQEHFTFIKVEGGYKLLSVQLKDMTK